MIGCDLIRGIVFYFVLASIAAYSSESNLNTKELLEDPNGYITFCPCMGRFGNQADQYLGALDFAKQLNRTLLLPAWVTYETGNPNSVQLPFSDVFRVDAVNNYHRSVPLELFMKKYGNRIWPKETRTVFCYSQRQKLNDGPSTDGGCNAKDGNPFGSFWNTYGIDFVASEFYSPLHYEGNADQWNRKYPAEKFPVIAMTGAPGAFPVRAVNRPLQKYFQWAERITQAGDKFIKDNFGLRPFVGIHLRNGIDWDNACEHVDAGQGHFFASPQCLGERNENGKLYAELCKPPRSVILKQVRQALKRVRSKSLFVATDNDDMAVYFKKKIKELKVYRLDRDDPFLDLYILGRSNYYLGSCLSSFSSFVFRERAISEQPSEFWAFPPSITGRRTDEL